MKREALHKILQPSLPGCAGVCTGGINICRHSVLLTGLICQFSEPPSPAGKGDSGCSASPRETCSSCGTSGCIHPIRLEKQSKSILTQANSEMYNLLHEHKQETSTFSDEISKNY